jgi:hypothetical protein
VSEVLIRLMSKLCGVLALIRLMDSRHGCLVAKVATAAPRSSIADTLLLFNNWARTEKLTKLHHYEDQFLKLFKEIIAVYTENLTKHEKNADLQIVKQVGQIFTTGL